MMGPWLGAFWKSSSDSSSVVVVSATLEEGAPANPPCPTGVAAAGSGRGGRGGAVGENSPSAKRSVR